MAKTRIVHIVNRTTEPLDCMYDGVPDIVPPGYKEVLVDAEKPELGSTFIGAGHDAEPLAYPVEYFAAEAYKRQHPRMGTQDPGSVDARDTEYLLGVEAWGDDIGHIEQTEALELIDRTMLPAHRQNAQQVDFSTGRHNRVSAKERKEQRKKRSKLKAQGQANRRKKYTDQKLMNPTGMRANYD